jgi:transmembrane sensor
VQLTRLKRIIDRYLKGKSTEAEHRMLDHWLDTIERDSPVDTHTSEEKSNIIRNRIFEKISKQTAPERRPVLLQPWMKVAAALIPLLAVSCYLILMVYGDVGQLHYSTAIGEYKEVILPDSSKVTLKPGSSLSFPEKFGNTRNVSLQGEAFFDVRRNPDKKFVVSAGALAVQVLGTSFMVKAYGNMTDVSVVVHSGKVRVSDHDKTVGLLLPSDKLVFDKNTSRVSLSKASLDDVTDRGLLFEETTLKEILLTLEFHYPVQFSGDIPDNIRLSGAFDNGMTVEQIVDALNTVIEQYKIRISKSSDQLYVVR